MTKQLLVDPELLRAPGILALGEIPLNIPAPNIQTCRDELGDGALTHALRSMVIIREFESMLDALKKTGSYAGIAYNHEGPAHLSVGQEAAAVGQSMALGVDDFIFGSHRSHGEFLAKGLSAIYKSADAWLEETMQSYRGGCLYDILRRHAPIKGVKDEADQYLIVGLLAEIFGRTAGFNGGLGGSMHAFFPPFGIYPNNAIVAGSAPIATGAALWRRVQSKPGCVVANIGDASTGCGVFWESLNFAAMGQLQTLWDEAHHGGLPIIYFIVNNFYGMGGQTIGETMAYDRVSRIGAGMRPDSVHAETVDGQDVLAVWAAVSRARRVLEAGEGPVLLDVQTYRQSGHSPSDASTYRTREEVALWGALDPIQIFSEQLVAAGVLDDSQLEEMYAAARELTELALRLLSDLSTFPRLDLGADPDAIAKLMFSSTQIDLDDATEGATLAPLKESTHFKAVQAKSRSAVGPDGKSLPKSKTVLFRDALFEALAEHVTRDGRVVLYGEENRDWGGAFGVYRGLTDILPYHRLFNAPISEAAIVGTAVGYAMAGGRAVVELMYSDFLGRAGDEVFNQLAKWQSMSGGVLRMPVVLRTSVGSKYGAQHSQDWSSLAYHIPGLKIAYPATPYDAKGLLASALSGDDPVIFLESQRLYDQAEVVHKEVPAEYYKVPFGEPFRARAGDDLTIATIGPMLYRALVAAERLATDHGIETEVIDLRTLVPLNPAMILESVGRTGRLLIVGDSCARGSWMHTLASLVSAEAFPSLDAPVVVIGAPNWITPPAEMEDTFFPTVDRILAEIHARILPLDGYDASFPLVDLVAESSRGA